MSVRAHRVLTHPNLPRLNQTDLLVLCRILAHLNEKAGVARPSIETLAELISTPDEIARGVDKTRTVQRAIRRIEATGIMRIELGGGAGNANRYHFTNPVIHGDTVTTNKPRRQSDTVSDRKPRQPDTETPSIQPINPVTQGDTRTEERRNGEGRNGLDRSSSIDAKDCGDIIPPAGSNGKQPTFIFQTTTGPWTLTHAQRDDLRERYPFIHVDGELAGLADWTEANPERRKKPGAMHGWLRARLSAKQGERPLKSPAFYGDGFAHKSLPTDPTPDELNRIMADD